MFIIIVLIQILYSWIIERYNRHFFVHTTKISQTSAISYDDNKYGFKFLLNQVHITFSILYARRMFVLDFGTQVRNWFLSRSSSDIRASNILYSTHVMGELNHTNELKRSFIFRQIFTHKQWNAMSNYFI